MTCNEEYTFTGRIIKMAKKKEVVPEIIDNVEASKPK